MRCDHCPVRPGLTCLGETHPPVCRDVANGLPGRAEQVVALAEGTPTSLASMAGSFVKAAVAHVADGARPAPIEVQVARKKTCEACPHFDASGDRCALCGCRLGLKRSWASSACPDTPPRWRAV